MVCKSPAATLQWYLLLATTIAKMMFHVGMAWDVRVLIKGWVTVESTLCPHIICFPFSASPAMAGSCLVSLSCGYTDILFHRDVDTPTVRQYTLLFAAAYQAALG